MTLKQMMLAACPVLIGASTAFGEVTIDVAIPNFGFTTLISGGYPEYDGMTVVAAEFFLELDVITGDASTLVIDMTAAVDTDPSTEVVDGYYMSGFGADFGWSGLGIVSHTFDASGFIGGVFDSDLIYGTQISGRPGDFFDPGDFAVVTENSYFRLTLVPTPSSSALLGLTAFPLVLRRRRK